MLRVKRAAVRGSLYALVIMCATISVIGNSALVITYVDSPYMPFIGSVILVFAGAAAFITSSRLLDLIYKKTKRL